MVPGLLELGGLTGVAGHRFYADLMWPFVADAQKIE
jgi:hypothetical protein